MLRYGFLCAVILFTFSLIACSSKSNPAVTPIVQSSATQHIAGDDHGGLARDGGMAVAPPPFRVGIDVMHPDSTKSSNHDVIDNNFHHGGAGSKSNNRAPDNVLIVNDRGGQAGINIPINFTFSSISANQTIYSNYFENAGNSLYAPTMKMPGNGCLEATTIYSSTSQAVGFWDFCIVNNSAFHNTKTVDATFLANYVRNLGSGLPQYTVAIVADTQNASAWHGLLFNYATGLWEDIYDGVGVGQINGGQGWDMFETHYSTVGQQCQSTPLIQSDSLSLSGILATGPTTMSFMFGDCFDASGIGRVPLDHAAISPASTRSILGYAVNIMIANSKWQIGGSDPAPPCTPDASGYCVASTTRNTQSQQCFNQEGARIPELQGTITFNISTPTGILAYVETIVDDGSGNCVTQLSWSPAEPTLVYGDPNLP